MGDREIGTIVCDFRPNQSERIRVERLDQISGEFVIVKTDLQTNQSKHIVISNSSTDWISHIRETASICHQILAEVRRQEQATQAREPLAVERRWFEYNG